MSNPLNEVYRIASADPPRRGEMISALLADAKECPLCYETTINWHLLCENKHRCCHECAHMLGVFAVCPFCRGACVAAKIAVATNSPYMDATTRLDQFVSGAVTAPNMSVENERIIISRGIKAAGAEPLVRFLCAFVEWHAEMTSHGPNLATREHRLALSEIHVIKSMFYHVLPPSDPTMKRMFDPALALDFKIDTLGFIDIRIKYAIKPDEMSEAIASGEPIDVSRFVDTVTLIAFATTPDPRCVVCDKPTTKRCSSKLCDAPCPSNVCSRECFVKVWPRHKKFHAKTGKFVRAAQRMGELYADGDPPVGAMREFLYNRRIDMQHDLCDL